MDLEAFPGGCGGFQQLGVLFGSPYDKGHGIFVSILGLPFLELFRGECELGFYLGFGECDYGFLG